ncbi:hypothetical protein DdX_12618 [Ditylenchus destructor]|uniref:Uncharacterized protein n=1 Tax=Ditylenchus destructor TaxID=166010 RepID=A0AAD4QX54_9BILA|nr:hypothetical protein DdX_12618 [Ditylenchus destructor]
MCVVLRMSLVLAILLFIWHIWILGALELIGVLLYLCVILAQYKLKPSPYTPFLIENGILLVLYRIFAIILLIIFFSPGVIKRFHDEWEKERPGKAYSESDIRHFLGGLCVGVFIFVAICLAFWYVVYRAYRYMTDTV